ncbi:MAG: NifU family protein [Aquificota bacterium]|nr:NifU family protein [Aquificota bacterium]
MIKPYVRSHGGDVELVDIKGDTVYVRLKGACQGCSQVSITLKEGILEAIKHHVPEIKDVKLAEDRPVEAFVDTKKERVWKKTYKLSDLREGYLMTYKDGDIDVILINWRGRIYVYRNSCAHQGLPLTGGEVTTNGTLICPWHGFEYDIVSGECVNASHIQLEPVPVKIEGEWVLIGI